MPSGVSGRVHMGSGRCSAAELQETSWSRPELCQPKGRGRGCLRIFVSLVGPGLLLGAKPLRPHLFRTQCKSHFFREAPLGFSVLLRPECGVGPCASQ